MMIQCWNCHKQFDIIKAVVVAERGQDQVIQCPKCGAEHAGGDIPAGAIEQAERFLESEFTDEN